MKRPPWYAIVLGLCAWGGIIALAVMNDVWWPLWIAGGIGVVVLFGGGAFVLFARGMAKNLPMPTAAAPPLGKRGDEPIAEPPKKSGREGPRTNARTAGRRNRGAASAVAIGLWLVHAEGCRRGDDEPAAQPADSKDAKEAKTEAKVAAPGTAASEDPALTAALARAILPPPTGEAQYEVDPFVAALVYERVRLGQGPTLTRLTEKKEGGPQDGYVVGEVAEGSLYHRLGLRTGDVIEAINGVTLVGPERLGFALDGAGNRVDLTIHRDDVSVVQSYRFTDGVAWRELLASFTGGADPRLAAAGDDGAAADDGRGEGAVPSEPTPVPSSDEGTPPPEEEPRPPMPSTGGGGKLPPSGGGSGGGGSSPRPSPKPTPSPRPTPTPTPTPSAGASQVQCESSSKCTMSKSYFDSIVNNPSKLESQANIVPAIQNDVHSGYKLKSIKPGSAIQKLGFQSNDKITHINGADLTDDFQAAQLYMGVANTSVFKIRYERGSARLVKTVVVK